MDMDIRIPIGLLFLILGALLAVYGVFTINDAQLYARSLGKNLNLWTGLLMLAFGFLMLLFPMLAKHKSATNKK